MQSQLSQLAFETVEKAQRLGAEMSEAFILNAKELSLEVREGQIENLKLAEERGLGFRVFKNGKMGFAYTADLQPAALNQVVQEALANSQQTSFDPGNKLPLPETPYPPLEIFDPQIPAASVEEKIEMAREVERVGHQHDKRIKITESAGYTDAEYAVAIVNSSGLKAFYAGTYCGLYLVVVAQGSEDNQTGFALQYGLRLANLDPKQVGREAAEKAVRMLGAKHISTRQVPVVLDPYVATSFLGVLAPALTAEAVQKGKSLFAGHLGHDIGSKTVSILDDGTLPGGIATAPFDGEGIPSQRTQVIEKGRLNTFLYNTYTATRDQAVSTGNGVRGSFKTTPEIGTTNFFIQPGIETPEALIADIPEGLYVTEVMGMHTANPISGDFSVGVAGLWIQNGELTTPVRGIALAGNLSELLKHIEGVGNDLTFFGGKGAPTLRIAPMVVSGT